MRFQARLSQSHYEVVDADGVLVGAVRHRTADQAHELRNALRDVPGTGALDVAEVSERLIIEREVVRLTGDRRTSLLQSRAG